MDSQGLRHEVEGGVVNTLLFSSRDATSHHPLYYAYLIKKTQTLFVFYTIIRHKKSLSHEKRLCNHAHVSVNLESSPLSLVWSSHSPSVFLHLYARGGDEKVPTERAL